jgi:succinate dehydrogenase / fumarate reductase, membrane anchor subunit
MDFKTPKSRVIGLGSAKDGVHHWWTQRLTAVALIPLTILALFPLAGAIGGSYEEVRETFANPFNAIVMILFIAVAFRHLALGLQVVIEDYVSNHGTRTALLLATVLLCGLFGLSGVFAVAKIAIAG